MEMHDLLKSGRLAWQSGEGKDNDVVLVSCVRLARNFRAIPFPNRANNRQLAASRHAFEAILPVLSEGIGQAFTAADMEQMTPVQRGVLLEKQFISRNFIRSPQHRVVFLSEDLGTSILVNEEDHLRIQCMAAGFDLRTPNQTASRLDDLIESKLDIAFDERMGYLTSCPTNLGTGLRASVLLHLPGLVFTKNIQNIANVSPQLGLAIRSVYGDEKESVGNLFLISNQLTLGFSEEELLANVESAVQEIVSHERQARKALALYLKEQLDDEVWRAYGLLRYARLLPKKETLELLSKVRLGIDLKLIHEVDASCFSEILVRSGVSYLQNLAENENLSKNEIDRLRAEQARSILLSCSRPQENLT
ncbi:MAG: ATP--guanido phosphotransferase [Mitsuokella sp.]